MSRLEATFAQLAARGRTGLVTYTTAGDPDLPRSEAILLALAEAGVDVLEVGVPFSDPVADGPVIQRAAERALAQGVSLPRVLEMVARLRPRLAPPVVLFTYANPVLRCGIPSFARDAASAGVDGVLVLDLPVEEAGDMHGAITAAGVDPIFLVSPTTSDSRIARTAAVARGFIYAISRLGVTGARPDVAAGAEALVLRVRAATRLPIALGFGISHPDHVAAVGRWADAAVVGSSLVKVIAEAASGPLLIDRVRAHVNWLATGCQRPGRAPRP